MTEQHLNADQHGVSRRSVLQAAAATTGAAALTTGFAADAEAALAAGKRAYVVVVDGCRPDEITHELTPFMRRWRDGSWYFPRGRSMPVLETIPNHVMMMTGVRPDRSGVPANKIYDRALGDTRDLDRPSDLHFPTLLTRLRKGGLRTASVLSKDYLHGIFGQRATYVWEPEPLIPITNHAPDYYTMTAALEIIDRHDPHLTFINLGSVDRVGHTDIAGESLAVARHDSLARADEQVKRLVNRLRSSGRWDHSMVIVLADHAMDWSDPWNVISLTELYDLNGLSGKFQIAQNGGADLIYWTGPAAEKAAGLRKMRRLALDHDGVLSVRDPDGQRLGPRAGDLAAYCKAGWRFSDPTSISNPIPGNHGHPNTRQIPFWIGGGAPVVRHGFTDSRIARTVDVAPTVGEFFRLPAPSGGYDGRSLI